MRRQLAALIRGQASHWWGRVVPSLLAAMLLISACGASPPSRNLSTMALRLPDLPHGMEQASARWWSNAAAARRDGIAASVYLLHGRLRSYSDHFVRSSTGASTVRVYLQRAESEVTQFRTAAGARWDLKRLRAGVRRGYMWGATTLGTDFGQASVRVPFRPASAPRVGTVRAAYMSTWGGDEFAYTTCIAIFQRRQYVVRLQVTALQEGTARHEIATLARRIDRRLQ